MKFPTVPNFPSTILSIVWTPIRLMATFKAAEITPGETRGKFKITRKLNLPSNYRTYKEELYTARRFHNPSANSASLSLMRLNQTMRAEGLVDEVKSRREFLRPSIKRVRALFKSRQGRFNEMLRETLGRIKQIHESRR